MKVDFPHFPYNEGTDDFYIRRRCGVAAINCSTDMTTGPDLAHGQFAVLVFGQLR